MRRNDRLPLILDLLDDGLWLYRQYWSAFALITATGFVPLLIIGMALLTMRPATRPGLWAVIGAGAVLTLVVGSWMIAALSRATAAALAQQSINIRTALAVPPTRLLRGGWFALVRSAKAFAYYAVGALTWGILVGGTTLVLRVVLGAALGAWNVSPQVITLVSTGYTVFGLYFLLVLVIGMPVSAGIHVLQPWLHERHLDHTAARIFAELWRSDFDQDGLYFAAALVCSGICTIAGVSAGVALWPLITFFVQPDATGLISLAAPGALLVSVPPLPIWMALLYRHAAAVRAGNEFADEIAAWHTRIVSEAALQPRLTYMERS